MQKMYLPAKYVSIPDKATDKSMSAIAVHFHEHECLHLLSMLNLEGEYGE